MHAHNMAVYTSCCNKRFAPLVNPRRACAARVTVLVLHVSWGAIFSVKGEKGGKKRGKERKGSKVKVGREI